LPPDRKAERPDTHLGDFTGVLQVDGYGGYAALDRRSIRVSLKACRKDRNQQGFL
jgi:hypothetical protein